MELELNPTLCQLNAILILKSYILQINVNVNVIFPPTLHSLALSFPFSFSN